MIHINVGISIYTLLNGVTTVMEDFEPFDDIRLVVVQLKFRLIHCWMLQNYCHLVSITSLSRQYNGTEFF